jgi:ribonuclease-3
VTTAADWCQKFLGYRFADEELLAQALTHSSAGKINNQRLEFLGDAVLGFIAARALYEIRQDSDEGGLSRLRSELVRRETLAELARDMDVGSQIIMANAEHRNGGHERTAVLADALEALFGAILLDGGFEVAGEAIRRVLHDRLANLPDEADLVDSKTRLQEYLQGKRMEPPDYSVESAVGADHAKTFAVICRIPALELEVRGTGTSRRRAEQSAATCALEQLTDG